MYNEELGIEIPDEFDEDAVETALIGILTGEWDTEDTMLTGAHFETFEQARIMTLNSGIVIQLPSGREFQVTIIRSR